jgi:hypothetical protein
MAFPRWSVGTINGAMLMSRSIGAIRAHVTMPGGKGWWMLMRGIETLERQAWHSHAGAWE